MKTSIKRFSKRTLSIVLAVMMLITTLTIGVVNTNAAFTADESVGAQHNLNWQGKVYFRAPDTWDIDAYPKVQIDITRTTEATTKDYQYYATTLSRIGNSRLFYGVINADHSNWNQNEYVCFTANDHEYGSGTFALNGNHYYTTPLDYGFNNSNNYYFVTPKSESDNSTSTNYNAVTASSNSLYNSLIAKKQTVNLLTDGVSSASGGSVTMTGYYPTAESTIAQSSTTSSSASISYDSAVEGSAMTLKATSNASYKFDGWYDSSDNLISSSDTYTYNVFGTKTINARFSISETLYNVTVASADDSKGTVSPATVQAGETTNPTITATPNAGYDFDGWTVTGGASVADVNSATTTVSATAEGTVTANFVAKQTYDITVNSADGGSVTSNKNSTYQGDTVTLTVSPDSGKSLTDLTVKDADDHNVETTKMSDTTYTFVMPSSAVTVTPTFAEKTMITLYLKNSAGWTGDLKAYVWNSNNTSENNSWPGEIITNNTIKIGNDTFYYYTFSPDEHSYSHIIFNNKNNNNGSQTVNLTISGHNNQYYDNKNNTDIWYDLPIAYDLTVTSGENGSVKYNNTTVASGQSASVRNGGTATSLIATPNTGYKFSGWTVTGDATVADVASANTTITCTADGATVTASFEPIEYTLTKGTESNGTFTLSKTTANYNDAITVTCTPNTGYKTAKVTFNATEATISDDTATFTMPAEDVTVNVTFAPIDYAVTTSVSPENSGSITVKKQGQTDETTITQYNIGDELLLKAAPNTGYRFDNFTVTYADATTQTFTESQATLSTAGKTGAIEIVANFSLVTYTGLTAEAEYTTNGTTYDLPLNDAATIDAASGTYADGVQIHAADKDGYVFVRWDLKTDSTGYVDNAASKDTKFFPSADNAGVVAKYKKLYTVNAVASGNGTGTVTVEKTGPQPAGDTTKITCTAANDSLFTKLLVNGKEVTTTNGVYTLTYNATNDGDKDGIIDVEAVFNCAYYIKGSPELTVSGWDHSDANNMKPNGDGTYSVTFKDISSGTYKFKPWKDNGGDGVWYHYSEASTITEGFSLTNDGEANYQFTISDDELYDVTITFNPDTSTVDVDIVPSDPTLYTITLNDEDSEYKTAPATVSAESSKRGKMITVTTSPVTGYKANVTVTNNTTGDEITVTDNQFKMPGSDVTVAVTYTEIPKYNVTVVAGENGTSYFIYGGETFTVAGGTTQTFEVTEGDNIALNATPVSEDYSFNKWVRSTDSTTYSNASVTDQTITQNVTYTSSFKETPGTEMSNMYLVYNTEENNKPSSLTKSTKVYKKGNYIYAYLPDDVVKKGLTSYFALSSTTSWSNMYWVGNDNLNVFTDDSYTQYVSAVKQHYGLDNINYYFGKLNVKSDKVTGIKFNLGELGEDGNVLYPNYEVIPIISSTPSTQVDIIAKDGTIRSTYQKYADMADTKFVSGHNGTPTQSTYYESASATVGSTVTITTTVQEAYRDKYYVRGFVVNGQTYSVNTSARADGVYTLTLPITEDMGGETLEVTPVYFYADNNDTITFYVKGFNDNVVKLWGNTIAAHFWYEGGSETSEPTADDKNALGGYPGQPLLNEGGFYYVQVPKHLNGDISKPVVGVTLNNYVWDDIHGGLVTGGTGNNCQTYDFKDFVRLSELTGDDAVDNIIFDFKYKELVENRTLSAVPTSTSTDVYKNGWEDLTDYYSRKVDIYGNLVTDETLSPVYVVSKGYQSGTTEVPTDTYGAYATSWTVYQDGSKVFTSNCAALINASSQNESLVGHPTYITYEKSIFDGDQKGNRSDGRWYYSKKGDRIEANVIIQYSDTKNGTYVTDNFATDSNIGAATGTSAYFTDDDYYGKTTESALIDESDYFNFNAETDADGQYTFLGWYQLNSDGEMTLFSTDQAAKSPKAGNATFVARFYKTPTGSLTISHKLYSTAPVIEGMPEVKGGLGACKVKVEIVDPSGNVIRTYDETSGSITISPTYIIKSSQNKLKITLTSTPAGVNTFYSTYRAKDNSYVTVSDASAVGSISTVTTVRTVDISSLFDDNGNLVANSLNYYSDYVPQTKDYKITFNYTDRFGTPQIYVVKGTLSESYITTNGAVLSDDFVMKKAPYEDNFGETIKWDDADITYGTSGETLTANVNSIQTGKDVHLNYRLNPDDVTKTLTLKFGDLAVEKDADGTYKQTPNGKYYYLVEADESYNNKEFSYWNIYSDSDESDLVAKCYSRKFNYVLYKDYYIVPVFEGHQSVTEDDTYTTIQLLEYSRNQWTDEEGVKTSQTDRLYADFQLSFNKNGTLITDATDVKSCGIVFEVGTKLTEDLASAFKDHPERFAFDTDTEALKQSISVGSKKSAEGRNLLKTDIDPKSLSNKNRIEFYKGFANAKYDSATDTYNYTNAMYVMKAYSYMIDTDGNVTLSNPVYVNFYDIASMQYTVS